MAEALFNIPGSDCSVCIMDTNLFEQDGLKIVHCPWTFDTSDDVVPEHSVFGKFLKISNNKGVDINRQIDLFCKTFGERARKDSSRKHRTLVFEVGELCPLYVGDEQYCLAAFSNTDSVFSAHSLELSEYLSYWRNLWHNLTCLTIDRRIVNVAVPGDRLTNISAESFQIQQKVAVIVNTFLQHNKKSGICKQLNICLFGNDAKTFDYDGWGKSLFPFLCQMSQLFSLNVNKTHQTTDISISKILSEESTSKAVESVDVESLFINDFREMITNIEKHVGEEYSQNNGNRKVIIIIDSNIQELNAFIDHFESDTALKKFFIRKHGVKYDKNKMFEFIGALHDSTILFGSLNRRSVIKLALDTDNTVPERWSYLGVNIDNIINYVGQKLASLKKNELEMYNNIWRMVPVPFRNR